jgi:hypothetical protein
MGLRSDPGVFQALNGFPTIQNSCWREMWH